MHALGLFVVFGFVIVGIPAPGPDEHHHPDGPDAHAHLRCLTCPHHAKDLSECTHEHDCPGHDHKCGVELRVEHGETHIHAGCMDNPACDHTVDPSTVAVGKRQPGHHDPHHDHNVSCRQCCDTPLCNTAALCATGTGAATNATTIV